MPESASTPQTHRCQADIDLDALRHNASVARDLAGDDGRIMAVVKADAYGHGAAVIATTLEKCGGADGFGVACLDEASELRAAGVRSPVYLLSPSLPDEQEAVVRAGFIPAVSSADEARAYDALAQRIGRPAAVHLVIDTGMGRIGALESGAVEFARSAAVLPGLIIDSVASHFSSADEEPMITWGQQARFWSLLDELATASIPVRAHHIANSAGALGFQRRRGETLRVGLMLYGLSPLPAHQSKLRPILTWTTRVLLVRDLPAGWGISYGRTFVTKQPTRAATLAVGYADGYPRHLSGNNAHVLIAGHRCPVLGRVTMDQIIVDVSALDPPPAPGDQAVLIGTQGCESIPATELATKASTIPYEIFTRLGRRVRKVYRGSE